MSYSDSRTPQNSSGLDNDFNKLSISGSMLPFNADDLVDTNTLLGASQFEVMQYRYNPVELDMAVKRLQLPRKRKIVKIKNKKDQLIKEAKILNQLKDSNDIVEFYGLCFDQDYALLCMELMDMNLSQLNRIILKFRISCPTDLLPNIFVPIIDGLEYCHKQNIIHRDIKPENILCNRRGKIKVGDFSESRVMDETNTGNYTGTILYWSPERVRSTEVKDPKYDIWGLGMTLLEIICGFHPYEKLLGLNPDMNENPIALTPYIENIDPESLLQCAHIQKRNEDNIVIINYANFYDEELELISRCLKRVDERATIDELKNTPYYKNAKMKFRQNNFIKGRYEVYEEWNKTLFKENFRELDTLIFEENSRRYNLSSSELQFRLHLYPKEENDFFIFPREMHICYHANADKWIILKNYVKDFINYFKYCTSIYYMIDELKFLHKFAGRPFIPKFYGWGSIEHNMISSYSYSICFEVMDMNLKEFYSHFINNFGYEAFKHALSEGILGYISCVVLNALLEINKQGFTLYNINSYNILLNDRGEIKLCGFKDARKCEDILITWSNIPRPSDVWCYAATFIEFACGVKPSCWRVMDMNLKLESIGDVGNFAKNFSAGAYMGLDEIYPRWHIFPKGEIELKEMSKNCFSIGYSYQPHEFFMECLKQQFVPNFDVLIQMDFYQQALKNIEENKAHLAKWVQTMIIAETRETVPARWFHKFMDPENAKIYDTSNRNPVMAHFPVPRTRTAQILKVDPKYEENLKLDLEHEENLKVDPDP